MFLSSFKLILFFLTFFRFANAFVYFPGGAAGMLFAVAIPLDLPKYYNVFMSYNFEANYRVPTMVTDFTKGPTLLHRVRRDGTKCVQKVNGDTLKSMWQDPSIGIEEECEAINAPSTEPLVTRKRIYNWIEEKLTLYGFDGKACLLRAICDHRSSSFAKVNGITGDILHILLSPYSSKLEPEMEIYQEAEQNGYTENCSQYYNACQQDLLELITHQER
ncbi:uncharacterized protein LOC134832281 [Culicoides brevitarsis]|uniref:uncharacterized protein LOC134832281 n=1 Tax=Culicoides brevitarsis TaxID=469753 RepID=UPI00307B42B7